MLLCIASLIVLTAVICAAVRVCDLEHVDFGASFWKLATFSLKVKRRQLPAPPPTKSPDKRRRGPAKRL